MLSITTIGRQEQHSACSVTGINVPPTIPGSQSSLKKAPSYTSQSQVSQGSSVLYLHFQTLTPFSHLLSWIFTRQQRASLRERKSSQLKATKEDGIIWWQVFNEKQSQAACCGYLEILAVSEQQAQ